MSAPLSQHHAESLILLAIQSAAAAANAPAPWSQVAALMTGEQQRRVEELGSAELLKKLQREQMIQFVVRRSGPPGWEATELGQRVLQEGGAPDPRLAAVVIVPLPRSRPSALAQRFATACA